MRCTVLRSRTWFSKADIDNDSNYNITDTRRYDGSFHHERFVSLAKWFTLRMSVMVMIIITYVIVIIINKLNITTVYYRACNTAIPCTRTRDNIIYIRHKNIAYLLNSIVHKYSSPHNYHTCEAVFHGCNKMYHLCIILNILKYLKYIVRGKK